MTKAKFLLLSIVLFLIVIAGTWFFLFRQHVKVVVLDSGQVGEGEVLNELRKIANFSADAKTEDEARLAIERYEDFLETYPNTLFADQICYYMGHTYHYQLNDFESAKNKYEEFKANFPYSKLLPLVEEQLARVL